MTFDERLDAERRERREHCTKLETLAHEIASQLGEGWTVIHRKMDESDRINSTRYDADIVHYDGYCLHLHTWLNGGKMGQWDGKLSVSGRYPTLQELSFTDRPRNAPDSINVTASRGAKIIANDIKRRLLSDVIAAYCGQSDRIRNAAIDRAIRGGIALRLAEQAGADFTLSNFQHHPGFQHISFEHVHTFAPDTYNTRIDLEISSKDVTFCASGSEELMAKLIAVYNAHQQGE